MNKKRVHHNEANRRQLWDRNLESEISSLIFLTLERIHENKEKFDIYTNIKFVNRYIKLLDKYVSDKNLKGALAAQICLDYACFHLGLIKPLHWRWRSQKGGRADKTKKGIWKAIEEEPQTKTARASWLWRHFERMYSGDSAYETPNFDYEIRFERDSVDVRPYGGYLIQKSLDDGKTSSIKFKTFEKYVKRIKRQMDPSHQ